MVGSLQDRLKAVGHIRPEGAENASLQFTALAAGIVT
jgi:hypothetical protein